MSPSPIDPNNDRYYVLDVSGRPVRYYDYTEHSIWVSCEGKGRQIKDRLLEHAVDFWTYLSGWASLKDDKPPMFLTTINGVLSKIFESETWEEAEDKHRRVLEKIRTTLPRKDGSRLWRGYAHCAGPQPMYRRIRTLKITLPIVCPIQESSYTRFPCLDIEQRYRCPPGGVRMSAVVKVQRRPVEC